MSFIKQYDRLFVVTFGVVNLIRGGGGLIQVFLALTGAATGTSRPADGNAVVLGITSLVHFAVLSISGVGLLARMPFGWKLSVLFHANDLTKLGSAFFMTVLLGAAEEAVRLGTDLLVPMTWSLFNLLVFLMKPIAEICRIDGQRIAVAAAPWILLGLGLGVIKLLAVL
jgi:hypothetical protein